MKKIAGGSLLNLHRSELFGIAALLIVIGHSRDFIRAIFPARIVDLIGYGGIGVTMFAFLSGVGLWQSLERNNDIKRFYIKRIQRVVSVSTTLFQ